MAFCVLFGWALAGTLATHSHAHGHAHAPPAESLADVEHRAETHDDEHQHSGDPPTDLETLGHTHAGGTSCPCLLPDAWGVPAHVAGLLQRQPRQDRAPGVGAPSTPFRPPIV